MEIFKTETTEQHLFQHNTADIGVVLWGWGGGGAAAEAVWKLLHQDHVVAVVDRDGNNFSLIIDSDRTSASSFHTLHFGLYFAKCLPLWASYLLLNILLGEDFPSTVQ